MRVKLTQHPERKTLVLFVHPCVFVLEKEFFTILISLLIIYHEYCFVWLNIPRYRPSEFVQLNENLILNWLARPNKPKTTLWVKCSNLVPAARSPYHSMHTMQRLWYQTNLKSAWVAFWGSLSDFRTIWHRGNLAPDNLAPNNLVFGQFSIWTIWHHICLESFYFWFFRSYIFTSLLVFMKMVWCDLQYWIMGNLLEWLSFV